jgi:hypothetical protein
MKLHDWVIQEAIRSGDILAAVNTAAFVLGLPQYAPDDPAILSMVITGKFYSTVPEQIRIAHGGLAYTWIAGESRARPWTDTGGTRIRIWTDHYEVK